MVGVAALLAEAEKAPEVEMVPTVEAPQKKREATIAASPRMKDSASRASWPRLL
jgi:hypothetical protein